jgi:hypothetical protein
MAWIIQSSAGEKPAGERWSKISRQFYKENDIARNPKSGKLSNSSNLSQAAFHEHVS